MSPQELQRRIQGGENATFELKAALQRPNFVARHLASFANSQGGSIVFGVAEPARIVGVKADQAKAIIEHAQSLLSPTIPVAVEVIQLEGRDTVVATVTKASHLIAAQGAFYWRTGDQLRPLNADEVRRQVTSGRSTESALSELSAAVTTQTKTIERLTEDFNKANSASRKLIIAGAGAIVGAALKYLFDNWLP